MRFRSIPPDPHEFPRLRLVLVPALPLLYAACAFIVERAGHQWNVHGTAIAVFILFFAVLVGSLVATLVSWFSLLPALRRFASLRTAVNLTCTVLSMLLFSAGMLLLASTLPVLFRT